MEKLAGLWTAVYAEGSEPVDVETAIGKGWEDNYGEPFIIGRIELEGPIGEYKDNIFLDYVLTSDEETRKFKVNPRTGNLDREATNKHIKGLIEENLQNSNHELEEVAGKYRSLHTGLQSYANRC